MASTHASRLCDAQQSLELVHARIMHMFPELVRELGGDPLTLIAEVTGSETEPSAAVPTLTLRQGLQVLELAATRLGCEDFGMRLAVRQYGGKIFGPVGSAMSSCSNYGEALRFAQTHSYAHSLVVSMWSETLNHEHAVFAGHEITLDHLPDQRQFLEQTLLAGNIAAKLLTDGKLELDERTCVTRLYPQCGFIIDILVVMYILISLLMDWSSPSAIFYTPLHQGITLNYRPLLTT